MRPIYALLAASLLAGPALAQKKKPARPAAKAPAPARRQPGPDFPSKAAPGSAAATVNGEAIPVSAYVDRLSLQFGPQVRDTLIGEALIRQEARRRKITVTAEDLRGYVERAYAETLRRAGGEERLAAELQRGRGWTPEDFRAALKVQAQPQLMRDKLAESLVKPDAVTDEEVGKRYEERKAAFNRPDRIRVSHILVRRPPQATEAQEKELRAQAEALLKRVQADNGKSFAQVAKEKSDDPATAGRGGAIPVEIARDANPFGAAFEAVVFNAPVGIVPEVVASPQGYHVFRVDEKTKGGPVPLAEVKEQIRAAMLFERRSQALDELLLRLRTKAKTVTGKY